MLSVSHRGAIEAIVALYDQLVLGERPRAGESPDADAPTWHHQARSVGVGGVVDVEQITRIALTVFTPILTAAIGIGALVVGDWRERRSQMGRRKLAFDDASRQVAFATEWWNASKLVASDPDDQERASAQAQAWLAEATTLVSTSEPPPANESEPITLRRLLIAYPMHSRAARILRAFYYFFLGLVVFQVGATMASAFGRLDTLGIPNYLSGGKIYSDLISLCVMTLIAMAFRFLSLYAEKSGATPETGDRMTVRRALLFYRLTRPAAQLARVVFWLWILFALLSPIGMIIDAFQDPRLIPGDLVGMVALVGWAIGLRYWAVSLEERGRAGVSAP